MEKKKIRHAIGLMSGTSADGVDAALVKLGGIRSFAEVAAFEVYPYPDILRKRILDSCSPLTPLLEIGELDILVGDFFAHAALRLLKKKGFSPDKLDFIGSHGQTIFHRPPSAAGKSSTPFTLQIGDGSVIAERTGVLTVSDFRRDDMAAGGEGAPLVPYVDWKLFTHPKKGRVLLNLGGIANFTYLPPGARLRDVAACDTGPGNALLDSLVFLSSEGKQSFDRDGKSAMKGTVNFSLLNRLLQHPFFSRAIPKSADRQWFGEGLARAIMDEDKNGSLPDWLATACALTAETVSAHVKKYAGMADEIYVSGGGVKNPALMRAVRNSLEEKMNRKIVFCDFVKLGIPPRAKEAAAFALLAHETLRGRPSNVPQVTGARRPALLGKVSQGWRKKRGSNQWRRS